MHLPTVGRVEHVVIEDRRHNGHSSAAWGIASLLDKLCTGLDVCRFVPRILDCSTCALLDGLRPASLLLVGWSAPSFQPGAGELSLLRA